MPRYLIASRDVLGSSAEGWPAAGSGSSSSKVRVVGIFQYDQGDAEPGDAKHVEAAVRNSWSTHSGKLAPVTPTSIALYLSLTSTTRAGNSAHHCSMIARSASLLVSSNSALHPGASRSFMSGARPYHRASALRAIAHNQADPVGQVHRFHVVPIEIATVHEGHDPAVKPRHTASRRSSRPTRALRGVGLEPTTHGFGRF